MTNATWWLSICVLLGFGLGASCQNPGPQPVPPATGGSPPTPPMDTGGTVGTGGVPGTGGSAPSGGTAGNGGSTAPSEAQLVCSHLSSIGCADGDNPDCVARIEFYQRDDRFSIDTDCLLLSSDVATARRCGSVTCGGTQ